MKIHKKSIALFLSMLPMLQ